MSNENRDLNLCKMHNDYKKITKSYKFVTVLKQKNADFFVQLYKKTDRVSRERAKKAEKTDGFVGGDP